jgi:hypothetical protein
MEMARRWYASPAMDENAYRLMLMERGKQIAGSHSARVLTGFLEMLETPEGAAQIHATGDDLEAIKEGLRQALRDKEREELRGVFEAVERAVAANDQDLLAEAHELFTGTTVRNLNRVVAHLEELAADNPVGDVPVLQTMSTFALAKNDPNALAQASQLYATLDDESRRQVFDIWMVLGDDGEELSGPVS